MALQGGTWRDQKGQYAGSGAPMPYFLGQEASCSGWGGGFQLWALGGVGAALRCPDPSSVPVLLPELATSPEAAPAGAETAAFSILPQLLTLPIQPPLPSGDSALESEQQAGGSEGMMGQEKEALPEPPIKKRLFFSFLLPFPGSFVFFPHLIPEGILCVI